MITLHAKMAEQIKLFAPPFPILMAIHYRNGLKALLLLPLFGGLHPFTIFDNVESWPYGVAFTGCLTGDVTSGEY